jgi:hypothetical protein
MGALTIPTSRGTAVNPAVKRKLDEIGDDSLPDQQRMANVVGIIAPLMTYAQLNEERDSLHAKKIKALKTENEKLELELASANKAQVAEAAAQKKLAKEIEDNRVLEEKKATQREQARRDEIASHVFGAVIGTGTGVLISAVTLNPLIGFSVGTAVGTLGQKEYPREQLEKYEKYERQYLAVHPNQNKMAWEYAKKMVAQDAKNN